MLEIRGVRVLGIRIRVLEVRGLKMFLSIVISS